MRFVLFMLTVCLLAGCGGEDAPALPQFTAEAGHYDKAAAFNSFITDHQGQTVFFDALLPEFSGEATGDTWFVLWDECEDLDIGETPNNRKCTGTSYTLSGPADPNVGIVIAGGVARLRGNFQVGQCSGPHQGLMDCSLQRLAADAQ